MRALPARAPARLGRAVALGTLVTAVGVLAAVATASAAVTLSAAPNTGLTNGQSVTVTGSGFAPSSPGNVLECNNAQNQPTVALGSPVNSSVSVGCTAPSLGPSLTSTSATGTVSKSYKVATGTIGPPCGASGDLVTTCPATDSAGKDPKADAAGYPCPPTPAQQAAGVTCSLSFGDQAGDVSQATISFQGESAPSATTTTAATPTTAAGAGVSATTAPPTASSSGSLAYTGPGPPLWITALGGLGLLVLAGVLRVVWRRAWRQ